MPVPLWNSLSLPWQVALEEAWLAYCSHSRPIGAVMTDMDGQILARGRNRMCPDDNAEGAIHGHVLAHAEINALLAVDFARIDPHGCILYTTVEPCPLCIGAIYMAGVREIHYASRDPFGGSVNLLGATPYLSRKPVHVYGPQRPKLETLLAGIHFADVIRERSDRAEALLACWGAVMPGAVAFSRQLSQTGMMERLRDQSLPIPQVYQSLYDFIQKDTHRP